MQGAPKSKEHLFLFNLEACVDGTRMLGWNCWLGFSKQAWCVVILLQHFPIDLSINPYKTTALGMVKDSMILIKNFMSWELAPLLFGGNAKGFRADSRWWSKLYSPTTLHVMRQQLFDLTPRLRDLSLENLKLTNKIKKHI